MTLGLSPEIQEDFGAVRSSTTPAGDAPDGVPAQGGAGSEIFDNLVEAWLAPAADDEDDATDPAGETAEGFVAALPLAQPLPLPLPLTLPLAQSTAPVPDAQSSGDAIAADAGSVFAPVQAADSRGAAQQLPVDTETQSSSDSSTIIPAVAEFEGQAQTKPASASRPESTQSPLSAEQGLNLRQDVTVGARSAARSGKTATESRSIAQRLSENAEAAADARVAPPTTEPESSVASARTAATAESAPLPESNHPESSHPGSKLTVGANGARPSGVQEKGTPAVPTRAAVNAAREIAPKISDVARSEDVPSGAGEKSGPAGLKSALAVQGDAIGTANLEARGAEPAPVAARVATTASFTTPAPQAATEISPAGVTESATIETDTPLDPPASARDVAIGTTTTAERGGSEHRAGQDRESNRDAPAGDRAESSPQATPGAEPPPFAESDAPAIHAHAARQAVTVLHGAAPALVQVQHVDAPVATLTDPAASSTPAPDTAERIVQSMKLQMGRGGGDAVVHLRPEHLGPVSITLRVENGAVSAVISAQHPGVAEWLQSNQQSLREGLEANGLQLERFVVQRDGQSPSDRQRREWFEARRRDFRRRLPASESTFEISM